MTPHAIGPYRVEAELGRGGAGVVYRARDGAGGLLAIKVLVGAAQDPVTAGRLAREAQVLLRLRHPSIVTVRATGELRGAPWLAMDLVEGRSLEQRLEREGPLPPREAASLLLELARAVAHAHAQGVLHRDIKPANVLLDAAGRPRLADFGLAKDLGAARGGSLTTTGQFLGTPAYWPPEQARGERAAVGPASDVFGLGATLYAMLTGRPPLQAGTLLEALAAVERDPPPPSSLRPDVPPALEAICLRCLRRAPAERYASADELAAALEGWLVARRRRPRAGRRWLPALTVAGAAVVVVGIGVAALRPRARPPADPPAPPDPAPPDLVEVEPLLDEVARRARAKDLRGALALIERQPPEVRRQEEVAAWEGSLWIGASPATEEGAARALRLTEGGRLPRTLVVRALALRLLGRAREALPLVEALAREHPDTDGLLRVALDVASAELPFARWAFLHPSDRPPPDPELLRRALALFERLAALPAPEASAAERAWAHNGLARLRWAQGDPTGARRAMAGARAQAPADPLTLFAAAELHLARAELAPAREAIDATAPRGVLPADPALQRLGALLTEVHRLLGRAAARDLPGMALQHERVRRVVPGDAWTRQVLAFADEVVLRAMGLRAGVDAPLDDDGFRALLRLADPMLPGRRRIGLAITDLLPPAAQADERVVVNRANLHVQLAGELAETDPTAARAEAERALALVQGRPGKVARALAVDALVRTGRPAESVAACRDLLREHPDMVRWVRPAALSAARQTFPRVLQRSFLRPLQADAAAPEVVDFLMALIPEEAIDGEDGLVALSYTVRALFAAGKVEGVEQALALGGGADSRDWALVLLRAEWELSRGRLDACEASLRLVAERAPPEEAVAPRDMIGLLRSFLAIERALQAGRRDEARAACEALAPRLVAADGDPFTADLQAHLATLRARAGE